MAEKAEREQIALHVCKVQPRDTCQNIQLQLLWAGQRYSGSSEKDFL